MFRKVLIFLFVALALAEDACSKPSLANYDVINERELMDPVCASISVLRDLVVTNSIEITRQLNEAFKTIIFVQNNIRYSIKWKGEESSQIIDDLVKEANESNIDIRHCVEGKKEELEGLVTRANAELYDLYMHVYTDFIHTVTRFNVKVDNILSVEIPDIKNQVVVCGNDSMCYEDLLERLITLTNDIYPDVISIPKKLDDDVIDLIVDLTAFKSKVMIYFTNLVDDFQNCFENAKNKVNSINRRTRS